MILKQMILVDLDNTCNSWYLYSLSLVGKLYGNIVEWHQSIIKFGDLELFIISEYKP